MQNQGGIRRVTLCPGCLNVLTCVDRAIRGYDALFCKTFEDAGANNGGNLMGNNEDVKDSRLLIPNEKNYRES